MVFRLYFIVVKLCIALSSELLTLMGGTMAGSPAQRDMRWAKMRSRTPHHRAGKPPPSHGDDVGNHAMTPQHEYLVLTLRLNRPRHVPLLPRTRLHGEPPLPSRHAMASMFPPPPLAQNLVGIRTYSALLALLLSDNAGKDGGNSHSCLSA